MNKTALFILAAIIIISGIWFITSRNDEYKSTGNNASTTARSDANGSATASTSATPGLSTVVVGETTAGNKVVVQSAQLSAPGYIVVYRSTVDGDTKIVGHSKLLEMGAYSNMSIDLNTSVATGETVTVVLHKDDGDGKFEVPGADQFLSSGSVRLVSDVDVVGSPQTAESPLLESQVETYVDEALKASTTSN